MSDSACEGVLAVDKPRGPSSHDVVAWVRRALGTRAVGHAGTLDPMATGVLVVLVGRATRFSDAFMVGSKRYEATVKLGQETDTLDAEGAVIREDTVRHDEAWPTLDAVARELAAMVGDLSQVPPAVSAIKKDGVPLYERVRRGEVVEVTPRAVKLHAAEVRRAGGGECEIAIACSKGFYVRALARDLAASLGTFGHLTALRRTESGGFRVEECVSGELVARAARGESAMKDVVMNALRPMREVTRVVPAMNVDEETARLLRHGRTVTCGEGESGARVVLCGESVVCLGTANEGLLKPDKVF